MLMTSSSVADIHAYDADDDAHDVFIACDSHTSIAVNSTAQVFPLSAEMFDLRNACALYILHKCKQLTLHKRSTGTSYGTDSMVLMATKSQEKRG